MKKYIIYTLIVTIAVFLGSCNKDDIDTIKANITNASYVKTLEDLIDKILNDFGKGDKLDLVLTLDKNGNITKISGEYK